MELGYKTKVIELNINDILPNRFQPRIKFNEDAINELAESIKEHGVIQPIVVRKINDKYEIIAGERRYKASVMAGKNSIPAIITDLNDKDSAEIALIENVQREDLTPIEEAVSYKKILNMGYLTQEDLSNKLGKKQSTISNKLRLLNLNENVQESLLEKKISERHARSLLKLNNEDQQMMLNRIINERMTVRKTDSEIDKYIENKNQVENATKNSNDIEILELEEKEENKGEMKMYNENNNNFNIPSTPIIEDVPSTPIQNAAESIFTASSMPAEEISVPQAGPVIPPVDTFDIPTQEIEPIDSSIGIQPITSPGFMDVDRIKTEATDINIEKPVADLGSLLEATPAEKEVEPIKVDASIFGFSPSEPVSVPESSPVEVKTGKFFDLDSLSEEEPNGNTMTTSAEEIEKMLNASVVKEEAVVIEEKQAPIEDENRSEMFGINLEPKNPEYVENIENKMTNLNFEEPKPIIDNNDLNFDQFYSNDNAPVTPVPESEVLTPTINPFPNPEVSTETINPIKEPEISVVSTPSVMEHDIVASSTPEFNNPLPIIEENNMSVGNIEQSKNPVNTPSYQVPSAEELDNLLNGLDSNTPISETTSETNIGSSIIDENETIAAPTSTIDINSKMDEVIAIIRNAKEKINALGIQVNIDEFDFDDMYQAIIKIDK